MDQQVSPAVVVIVLILIVAILVGLYFLVADRKSQSGEEPAVDATAGEVTPPVETGANAEPATGPAATQEAAEQGESAPTNSGPESAERPADAAAAEPGAPSGG